jgi:hypothetical protein
LNFQTNGRNIRCTPACHQIVLQNSLYKPKALLKMSDLAAAGTKRDFGQKVLLVITATKALCTFWSTGYK